MNRTFLERLMAPFQAERDLRRSPENANVGLTNKGRLFAELANLHPKIRKTASQEKIKLVSIAGRSRIEITSDDESILKAILKKNDDLIVQDVAARRGPDEKWDTGTSFAATLSDGRVAVRLPADMQDDQRMQTVTSQEGRRVALLTPNAYEDASSCLKAGNEREMKSEAEAEFWQKQTRDAKRINFVFMDEETVTVRVPDEFWAIRKSMTSKGGELLPDGRVRMSRETFIASGLTVRGLSEQHDRTVNAIRRQKAEAARIERENAQAALLRRGMDVRDDPSWVMRDESGNANFLVPQRATALLDMLVKSGAQTHPSSKGGSALVMMSYDDFKAIKPMIDMIRAEADAVEKGANGDLNGMETRVRAAAKTAGQQQAKSVISNAKSRRTRGAVSLSSQTNDASDLLNPLNPLNPIGVFQMSLWADESHREGVQSQAKSMGARVSDDSGVLSVEPERGDSWSSGSGSGYGSSSDYGSSSSSYDSGSSSSYDSGSSCSSD